MRLHPAVAAPSYEATHAVAASFADVDTWLPTESAWSRSQRISAADTAGCPYLCAKEKHMSETWIWPDDVRKKLHARRGGVEVVTSKRMTPAAAFKKLAKAYAKPKKTRKVELIDGEPVHLRLTSSVGRKAPEPGDVDEERRLMSAFLPNWGNLPTPVGKALVDYWVGSRGVDFATEVLLLEGQGLGSVDAFRRLRWHLAHADLPSYEAAHDVAAAFRETVDDRYYLTFPAYLFPGGWANELLPERWNDARPCRDLLLHSVDEPAAAEQLLMEWYGRVHSSYWDPEALASFVEGVGADAAESLSRLLGTVEAVLPKRTTAEALALIPTDDAFGVLLEHIADPAVQPFVTDAALRQPKRAARLLAKAPDTEVVRRLRSLVDRLA